MSEAQLPSGFPDYPNLHLDQQAINEVVGWDDQRHNAKTNQYREFMRRDNLLPTHRARGAYILFLLEFDGDCRDGIYDQTEILENNRGELTGDKAEIIA